jgi:hypothetical protein
MRHRLSRHLFVLVTAVLASGVYAGAQSSDSKRDSDKMQQTLGAIMERASTPPVKGKTPPPLRSTFTDTQFNAWLLADGKDNVPTGLLQPAVNFLAAGKLTAKAVVDLDAVRKSKPRGMLDPMNLLSGLVPVTLTGTLSGTGGMATFDVQSAQLGTWPLPRSVLQELIAYYSKSTEYPEGITLGKPFALPAEVKALIIAKGTATVVQ